MEKIELPLQNFSVVLERMAIRILWNLSIAPLAVKLLKVWKWTRQTFTLFVDIRHYETRYDTKTAARFQLKCQAVPNPSAVFAGKVSQRRLQHITFMYILICGRSRAARWDGVTRITAVRLSREPRSLWYDRGRSHIFEPCAAIWHRCPFSTAITNLFPSIHIR